MGNDSFSASVNYGNYSVLILMFFDPKYCQGELTDLATRFLCLTPKMNLSVLNVTTVENKTYISLDMVLVGLCGELVPL